MRESYNNLYNCITRPHLVNQRAIHRPNSLRPIPFPNIIRAKMHCNNLRRIRLQPPRQQSLISNVDCQIARVAFMIAVVVYRRTSALSDR